MYLKRFINLIIAITFSLTALAQRPETEMADKFRADGKIYVVIGVFAIIMAVMKILWLILVFFKV